MKIRNYFRVLTVAFVIAVVSLGVTESISAATLGSTKAITVAKTKTGKKSKSSNSGAASYILLPSGLKVKPGGTIPLSQFGGAVFVNGTGQNVMYAGIGSYGVYRVKADPEPNWAFEGTVAAGGVVPLSNYAAWMLDPYNTHFTMELRGTTDFEYSFAVDKAQ